MLSPCTVTNAREVAETLTARKVLITPKSTTMPLGVIADRLDVGAPQLKRSINSEGYDLLTRHFTEVNEVASEQNGELLEDLVEYGSEGVRNMLHIARNSIVPIVKARVASYTELSKGSQYPQLEIKPVSLTPLLQSEVLTEHLLDYPKRYGVRDGYRTYHLHRPEVDELVKWACETDHIDSEIVAKWLTKVDGENLEIVFGTLFSEQRVLDVDDIFFSRTASLITCADELLFAYFLTSYLRDNPQDPIGEGASLEQWETNLGELHGYFGLRLLELAKIRHRMRLEGRLVIRYNNRSHVGKLSDELTVFINPDLVDQWRSKGGTTAMLLGAGFLEPSLTRIEALLARGEELEAYWERKHRSIKMKADAKAKNQRRELYHFCMIQHKDCEGGGDGGVGDLPEVGTETFQQRVSDTVRELSEADLHDPVLCFTRLVCSVYFPGGVYEDFLNTMARCGIDIHAREAATIAVVEVLASWMAEQIQTQEVELDLTGEVNGSRNNEVVVSA